jgi:hypothetical protein
MAVLVMESIVAALWYQAIFRPPQVTFGTIFSTLFVLFAFNLAILRGMGALQVGMRRRQAVFLTWILLAGYGSLKLLLHPNEGLALAALLALPVRHILTANAPNADFFHLLGILLLLWRGVRLARTSMTINSAQASFQLGLALLLLYGMFYAPLYPLESALGLYTFLFSGLAGMSMARMANLSELRGGRVPRFSAGWLASVLAAGLAVVGLALLAGWAASGRLVEVAAYAFVLLLAVLTALALLLLTPLFDLMARGLLLLADVVDQVLSRLRSITNLPQVEELAEAINEAVEQAIPYLLAARGFLLLGALLAITAVILLALALRRLRGESLEEEQSERSEPGQMANPLLALFNRLRSSRLAWWRGPAQVLAAARVRQIYRNLMALSLKLGAARPPSTTPLEFLPRLEGLFPNASRELAAITGAYVRVRYGAYPETRAEVEEVERAWEKVRRQGQESIALHRKEQRRG